MNKIYKHFFYHLVSHMKNIFFSPEIFHVFTDGKKKLRKKSLGKKWQDIFVRKSFSEKPIFTRFHTFSSTKFSKGKKKVLLGKKKLFSENVFHPHFSSVFSGFIKRIRDIILANVLLHTVSLEKIPLENQNFTDGKKTFTLFLTFKDFLYQKSF